MNSVKSLLRFLKGATASKYELTAAPPFIKLVFDREELQGLLQGQSIIADAVSKRFVRRGVFWIDLSKEIPEEVLNSLAEVEAELDKLSLSLTEKKEPSVLGLTKFIRSWASACSLTRKNLKKRLDEIDDEKNNVLGYDSAGEDRVDALRDALIELRKTVYPLVTALINFLPDDDLTKQEAQRKLDDGWNVIANAQLQRESTPEWDEA